MTEFEASNGHKVQCSENNLSIKSPDGPIFICVPDDANIQALREFFLHERDVRLGRWRDPEDPSYVAYQDKKQNPNKVRIFSEQRRRSYTFDRNDRLNDSTLPGARTALNYFKAHPEPKPWLDAQSGEVWSISDGYADSLAICRREEQGYGDYHPYFYGPNFDGIRGDALTSGTRLEAQS